jgi:hypothetical protein
MEFRQSELGVTTATAWTLFMKPAINVMAMLDAKPSKLIAKAG